jgi:hypothetical protein
MISTLNKKLYKDLEINFSVFPSEIQFALQSIEQAFMQQKEI